MAAALVDAEPFGDAPRVAGEGGFDVAVAHDPVRHEIVRAIEPRLRRIGREPVARIGHGRQRIELDRDQACRVLGDIAAVRHDNRNRLAGVAELVERQREWVYVEADGTDRQGERNAVMREQPPQIVMGQHRVHARARARLVSVHAAQPRMRHRTAHEGRMQ